jgi:4-aminobutyrate aminotransferase
MLDSEIGTVDPEQVAFIIIEPVQGEGGYRIPASGFIQEVFEIAKKYNIPIIADEIQSGLGRTGKWFAFEHFGVKPDVITLGKTLRVGATVARMEMFPEESGRFGGTWGGTNATACAVGYRTLEIIERDNLMGNAVRVGAHLLSELKSLSQKYSRLYNQRGLGLMVAVSIDGAGANLKVIKECFKRGLLIFSCGFDSIRFIPPLDVTMREIDLALEIMDESIAAL